MNSATQAGSFHEQLYTLIDEYLHEAYKLSGKFPREEMFGTVSQLRRAAMSIMLNYQEGYARRKRLVKINFYEISFGSCKECRYIINFALVEKWIDNNEFQAMNMKSDRIASMLWKTMEGLENDSK